MLQAGESGKPKELVNIENGEWNEVNVLKIWKDDSWIMEWITNIEPKLSEFDLRPYFYFSRESQKNISFAKSQNLSQDAIKIMQQLFSGADTMRNEAIKLFSNVVDFEASVILNELAAKIESSTEIEKSLFQSLYIDVISILERLPVDKIKLSFIPLISPFANKMDDKSKIIQLLSSWADKKSSLKSAIADEIKNIKSK